MMSSALTLPLTLLTHLSPVSFTSSTLWNSSTMARFDENSSAIARRKSSVVAARPS